MNGADACIQLHIVKLWVAFDHILNEVAIEVKEGASPRQTLYKTYKGARIMAEIMTT